MRNLLILLVLLAGAVRAEEARQPEETHAIITRQSVTASRYMVAAAHPQAAEAGRAVLAAGGSAADAAVAIQMMLNLVEPQSSGIGGGAFALYWDAATATLSSWDGRETAPLAAGPDYWLGPDGAPVKWPEAVVGGRSVGVPGTLMLLERLHARFGRMQWAGLLAPAIRAAELGFPVSARLSASITGALEFNLAASPVARAYFLDADGVPWPEGHILTNPAFAETLGLIAAGGIAEFYNGATAAKIIAATRMTDNPGILTTGDFTAYQVRERPPVCAPYRGYQVCGMGPPSSGALTVGQILMLLERFDLAAMGPGAEAWHLFAEASKLAYADRALYMADSDFVDMPEGLLNREYMAARSRLIDPAAAHGPAEAGTPPWDEARFYAPDITQERPGTSHFVVVDAAGNMISMTTTIETGFGSGVMVGGFLLNNELTDFSFAPEQDGKPVANRVEGGKRPRSSMAPTIVLKDGRPVLLVGSPGGSRIIAYVAQALVAMLDWGMDPQAAVDQGHVANRNGGTDLEEGSDAAGYGLALQAMGHEVTIRNMNSGLHAILIGDGVLVGGADKRREGVVLGE
ncbi:MAG: gamma-glutamyltransferase [Rhodobacteraceae bacterium]|nr:gamma-glutamyltransferase [Paracoccaceae bacterium]